VWRLQRRVPKGKRRLPLPCRRLCKFVLPEWVYTSRVLPKAECTYIEVNERHHSARE
jgi:hypothetical protein